MLKTGRNRTAEFGGAKNLSYLCRAIQKYAPAAAGTAMRTPFMRNSSCASAQSALHKRHSKNPTRPKPRRKSKTRSRAPVFRLKPCFLHENGGYLLSHLRSTIGVIGLNCSVRNGKRWNPDAIATLISLGITPVIMLLLQTGKSRDRAT